MRQLRILVLTLALAGLLLVPASASARYCVTNSLSAPMVKRINAVRSSKGLPRLRTSRTLTSSSRWFANWQMRANRYGHLSRIRTWRRYRRLGEVISLHRSHKPRVGTVVGRWMRSPGHRRVLMHRSMRLAGAGICRGRFKGRRATIWVVQVGRR